MARTATIQISSGSHLRTQPTVSLDNVGPNGFSELVNLFRDRDQLRRLPGWVEFHPIVNVADQYTFDATESLLRQGELVRGDGTHVIIGASLTKIKWFNPDVPGWVQIGSGFSADGEPWQMVAISNVALFNNGVDLIQTWEIGDAAVTPLYEAREQGIASAGRIGEYNGFFFIADIVEIVADQLNAWMTGYANHTTTTTTAKAANFTVVAPTDHRTLFNTTTGASTITVTLPTIDPTDPAFYIWVAKVDGGAGTVVTSPVIVSEPVVLDSINDSALIWWTGNQWAARVFPSGVITPFDPYGIPPDAILEHIPDEEAWSDLGDPKNWAPLLSATMAAASTTIYLPFAPQNWVAGKTRIAVIGAGPDGGTLGGQTDNPEGVLITAIGAYSAANNGVPITLEIITDSSATYPTRVDITRWADVSTFVGKQRLGNGSRILSIVSLNGQQLIGHENGYFVNRFTGDLDRPFALREKYVGRHVPLHGDCVASIRNDYLVYPSKTGTFYQFDGISDPFIHRLLEDARDVFFSGLTPTDRIWAVDQPLLEQVWFMRPDTTLIYTYAEDSLGCTEMDAQIDAGCIAKKPNGDDQWFVLGIGRFVYQLAIVNGVISSWLRDGEAATPSWKSGLLWFGDMANEKVLLSYTPILASPSADADIEVQLYATHNPNVTPAALLDPVEALPDPDGNNFITTFFQALYFMEEVDVVEEDDVDVRVSARLFEVDMVKAAGVTRSVV